MSSFLRSSLLVAAATVASTVASPLSTYAGVTRTTPGFALAPLHEPRSPHGHVNGSYIVSFKDDAPDHLRANHFNFLQAAHESDPFIGGEGSGIKHQYDSHVMRGYAGHFTEEVLSQIRSMPEVALVERDSIVHANEIATQKGAPWGLARVSHRPKLGFSTFTKYEYEEDGGEGVDVYVIDTGININHVELEGRASWGKTIPKNDVDEDGNGHGSHCAGTIASAKYGVAKKANVIAVKVLGSNGSGSMSDVLAGVEFAAVSAQEAALKAQEEVRTKGSTKHKGSVANMSLGGGVSEGLDRAVNAAVKGGLHFAVAAGNENTDACKSSPARAQDAVTVAASTLSDERAYFSNYGKCVDVFAPGLNIVSIYKGSPYATATLSGTSMASPHVAGLMAYLLSIYPHKTFNPVLNKIFDVEEQQQTPFSIYSTVHAALPSYIRDFLPTPSLVERLTAPIPGKTITPAQMKEAVKALASPDLLGDVSSDTPNLLVFNNATGNA